MAIANWCLACKLGSLSPAATRFSCLVAINQSINLFQLKFDSASIHPLCKKVSTELYNVNVLHHVIGTWSSYRRTLKVSKHRSRLHRYRVVGPGQEGRSVQSKCRNRACSPVRRKREKSESRGVSPEATIEFEEQARPTCHAVLMPERSPFTEGFMHLLTM